MKKEKSMINSRPMLWIEGGSIGLGRGGDARRAAMPPNPAGGEAPLRLISCYKDQGDDVANPTRVPMNLLGKSQTFGGQ